MAAMPAFAQSRFSDVNERYWASEYVRSLTSVNVISGFPGGTFRPDTSMTRAEFAAVLSKGFSQRTVRQPITFTDVPSNHWAAGAIASAYSQGFLVGYPNGAFGPEQPITRLEVLSSIVNGLGLMVDLSYKEDLLNVFSDRAQIPEWAGDAIAAATFDQLVINYPNVRQLNPNRNASRAEIVAIVHQALDLRGATNPIASRYIAGH